MTPNLSLKTFVTHLLALGLGLALLASQALAQAPQPRLVLAVVVDQFRYDYLIRHRQDFQHGLQRLLEEGAVFTNAHYEAAPTVTAVGHSTILTGATPSVSGIAGNSWYERAEGQRIESITDDQVAPLGGSRGASPKRLLVSTVGDEIKVAGKGGKVYGVSMKDRGAILPAGRSADGAFWFDGNNGHFVSSGWYFQALPDWAEAFNAAAPADRFAGAEWLERRMPLQPGPFLYRSMDSSPFGDQLVLEFSLALMEAEGLGTTPGQTDLLSVSFSAMDYVGHATGTDTPEMRDMVLSADERIGELLAAAEAQAGAGNVLLVFTADHGVSPIPEENMGKQLPGGRYDRQAQQQAVEAALTAAFGEGDYIEAVGEYAYYLRREPIPGQHIDHGAMQQVAAEALRRLPHMLRVYTRSELESGQVGSDRIDQRVRNGFSPHGTGDVVMVHKPNWLGDGSTGTTHGSPFNYDTHVPLIFWGPESLVKPGRYHQAAAIHDIAQTLSTLLDIPSPSGAMGRVLVEILP